MLRLFWYMPALAVQGMLMMWIDILAFIILLGFAAAGATTGGTAQILRLGAAICAVIGAPIASKQLAGPIAATFPELPTLAITGISLITAAVLIYLVLALITHFISEIVIKSSAVLTAADRAVGLGVGIIKAVVLLFIVGHGLLALRPSMPDLQLENSRYLAMVETVQIKELLQAARIESHLS